MYHIFLFKISLMSFRQKFDVNLQDESKFHHCYFYRDYFCHDYFELSFDYY